MSSISVIMPVYNAELYLPKAIRSALSQPEVYELVVIEDGSTDQSLSILLEMAAKDSRIKLHQHPDKKNHGRSASRNLGVRVSVSPYIAFLDADDFYLPNRFAEDIKTLKQHSDADGVYNAIGAHFYRKAEEKEAQKLKLTTVHEALKPTELFDKMGPIGHYGYFSGDGLTVKRSVFKKTGGFNEALAVAEDTELWLKMALVAKLLPGNIRTPVAMRGIHANNTSFKDEKLYIQCYEQMYQSLFLWSLTKSIPFRRQLKLWKNFWLYRGQNNRPIGADLKTWFVLIFRQPRLLLHKEGYKRNPVLNRIKNSI